MIRITIKTEGEYTIIAEQGEVVINGQPKGQEYTGKLNEIDLVEVDGNYAIKHADESIEAPGLNL